MQPLSSDKSTFQNPAEGQETVLVSGGETRKYFVYNIWSRSESELL